jgi:hypothetical protein
MTDIMEQYPYPTITTKRPKFGRRTAVTKEDAKKINAWCRNPKRVKEVIRRFHIWSLKHQWCADDETRQWVEENIEEIKEKLNI